MNGKLIALLAVTGMLAVGTASADDFLCSDIGPEITSNVNGNVFVDVDCTVEEGAFFNGNMIQTISGKSLTVRGGAEVNGNLEQFENSVITIKGRADINGNVYHPDEVICMNATVNGNIDDNISCVGVASSCSVNGDICGVGDNNNDDNDG